MTLTRTRDTSTQTVAEALESLLNDHVENHDPDLPQIQGRLDGTEADIELIKRTDSALYLELDDGTRFRVAVEQLARRPKIG